MSSPTQPIERDSLPTILQRKGHIHVCGIYDALTATLAQSAGFDALWLSGFALSASLGLPDNSSMAPQDLLAGVRHIALVAERPILVDCDAGYGDTTTTLELVSELASLGVSAISIEDYQHPKLNSFAPRNDSSPPLRPARDFALLLHRIKHETNLPYLIARTEALILGQPLVAALARAEHYAAAGADAILIHSRFTSIRDYAMLSDTWSHPTPLVAIPTMAPTLSCRALVAAGFSIVIRANELFRAVAAAARAAASALAAEHVATMPRQMMTMQDIFRLTGLSHADELDHSDGDSSSH